MNTPAPRKAGRTLLVAVAAALVVSLALSYGAYQLASYSWDQVVSYQSPYDDAPAASLRVPADGAAHQRVVLVLIDGLTAEAASGMDAMTELAGRGATVDITVPQPSLSYPTWTTIMSGAPQQISGVTTNWYEGRVGVDTLLDVAIDAGRRTLVAGPSDVDALFDGSRADASAFAEWPELVHDASTYETGGIVDDAIALDEDRAAEFAFVVFPDVDNAGHAHGAASDEYAAVVDRVDADLGRLVEALDDGETVFCVLPDHGHIASGGHGGWESPVIHTLGVLAGPGVAEGRVSADLEDIAPTVAVLAGLPTPAHARGTAILDALAAPGSAAVAADERHATAFAAHYVDVVSGEDVAPGTLDEARAAMAEADDARLAEERAGRLWMLLGAVALLIAVAGATYLLSWRALAAVASGVLTYALVYNALFFLVHGYRWSLSAFNDESMIQAFFNGRMAEAVLAGTLGCLVAAFVYPALRSRPRGVREGYGREWVALGVATALGIQATLAVQIGWFLYRWGADVVWHLPDFRAGFKYDLDLIQLPALGAVAIIGPLVSYLVGRFHPALGKPAS